LSSALLLKEVLGRVRAALPTMTCLRSAAAREGF
jgi:hypothetical protein